MVLDGKGNAMWDMARNLCCHPAPKGMSQQLMHAKTVLLDLGVEPMMAYVHFQNVHRAFLEFCDNVRFGPEMYVSAQNCRRKTNVSIQKCMREK